LEFNVPFQHKYGYIRDENASIRIRLSDTEEQQCVAGENTKVCCLYACFVVFMKTETLHLKLLVK